MRDIATKEDLRKALELQTLRLTVYIGAIIAASGIILFTALRHFPRG